MFDNLRQSLILILNSSSLISGLTFVRAGNYINMARVDPKVLSVENHRLRITESNAPACGIMVGLIQDCSLIAVSSGGSATQSYNVHRVTIAPAPQEFRRDVSLWGQLFGFEQISGPLVAEGFSFLTFGEGKGKTNFSCKFKLQLFIYLLLICIKLFPQAQALLHQRRLGLHHDLLNLSGHLLPPRRLLLFLTMLCPLRA